MFECFNSINVSTAYFMNIRRLLNMKEKSFAHLKSHDSHVLMTQLFHIYITINLSIYINLSSISIPISKARKVST
jgi:hypothetical protein